MINKLILILGISLLSFGCTTVKNKVNDKVKNRPSIDYAVEIPEGYEKITMVEIRKKGKATTIEELMPALKESVAELNFIRNVVITNIKIIPFPKLKQKIKKIKNCNKPFGNNHPVSIRKTDKNGRPTDRPFQSGGSHSSNNCFYKLVKKNVWADYFQITADVYAYPKTISL